MPESPYPGPPPPGPEPDDAARTDAPAGEGAAAADAAATTPAAPEPRACKVCGAELDPEQTYCLECGSPTNLAPRLRRGAGGLAAVAVGLAILGAGAGALAFVASRDESATRTAPVTVPTTSSVITVPTITTPTTETDSSLPGDTTGTTSTLPADTTFTTPTTPGTDTSGMLPSDTTMTVPDSGMITETGPDVNGQTTSEVDTTAVTPDPGTGGSSGTDDWPAGTSGWTAIVSSVRSESDARATASTLTALGESGGVLYSSDHPPLRAGYWVVFSGTFTTRSEALAHARTLVGRFPGAYPRQIDS